MPDDEIIPNEYSGPLRDSRDKLSEELQSGLVTKFQRLLDSYNVPVPEATIVRLTPEVIAGMRNAAERLEREALEGAFDQPATVSIHPPRDLTLEMVQTLRDEFVNKGALALKSEIEDLLNTMVFALRAARNALEHMVPSECHTGKGESIIMICSSCNAIAIIDYALSKAHFK